MVMISRTLGVSKFRDALGGSDPADVEEDWIAMIMLIWRPCSSRFGEALQANMM